MPVSGQRQKSNIVGIFKWYFRVCHSLEIVKDADDTTFSEIYILNLLFFLKCYNNGNGMDIYRDGCKVSWDWASLVVFK